MRLFKGTSVDGVYDSDPKKNPDAKRFDTITYNEILRQDLRIMDPAAIALARDNDIPLIVFSIREPGAVVKVLQGQGRFTDSHEGLEPWPSQHHSTPPTSSAACTVRWKRSSTTSADCAPAALPPRCSIPSMSMPMALPCR